MWKHYFKFVKLKPDKVVTSHFGEIDFSADAFGIEIIKSLYENGFPYLEMADKGKAELYGTYTVMNNGSINNISRKMKISKVISYND